MELLELYSNIHLDSNTISLSFERMDWSTVQENILEINIQMLMQDEY